MLQHPAHDPLTYTVRSERREISILTTHSPEIVIFVSILKNIFGCLDVAFEAVHFLTGHCSIFTISQHAALAVKLPVENYHFRYAISFCISTLS
jgi:hypothetical protein